MSQPIPVDILSDSDSDSGGDRRKNLRSEAIDLTTPPPFPQSKKKQRTEAISNPSGSTVFIIDDDPTPCKKTSDSTPSFVAETPFSDASLVGCSTRKYSVSGESLATEQLVVADTPMTERLNAEVSLVKCDTRVLNRDYASLMSNNSSAVADTPMTVRLNTEVSLTKRDARLLNSDYASLMSNHGSAGESSASEQLVIEDTPMTESLKAEVSLTERDTRALNSDYASLMSNHNSAETYGLICVDSDNESENVGVFEAPRLDGIFFGATPSDELEFNSRLVESSFSLGPSVPLQKKLMHNPVTVHRLEGCSSPDVLEDDIYVACDDTEDKASEIDPMAQMGSQQSNSGCFMKEKKKAAETMKPKRTSKEERLRLMEEKKKLKEQEKLLKAAAKAEAAELKKFKKEMQKWEKGKYALKSIVAEIDKKVVELGSIGV